jgi:hypothetical protein
MKYQILEREIAVGWTEPDGRLCPHWYIGRWGLAADLGTQPVLVVDYDIFLKKAKVITIGSYKHRHGG